ncbi:type VI secretion system-associated FHA domain protein TagH [Pseudomonas sp. R4-84]
MEVVFEVLSANQFIAPDLCRKRFGADGGVIGRGEDCDWMIPDRERLLSKRHAGVSFDNGTFFLTDSSGNGVLDRKSGSRLPKGEPVRITDGDVFIMGGYVIQARVVVEKMTCALEANRSAPLGNLVPDDAFLNLDPLRALDREEHVFSEMDELNDRSQTTSHALLRSDHACVDVENLVLPKLIEVEPEPPLPYDPSGSSSEGFWQRFGSSLGMDLNDLDQEAREALAIKVGSLLKQSVEGLQQGLRTRSELKGELRLAHTLAQGGQQNPLKHCDDALHALLQPTAPGQLPASKAIASAFRSLQAHQVALFVASRATLRSTLDYFSPRQLVLRLKREQPSLLHTSGRYWRAYGRHHQSLCQDDDWTERLLARDFAKAYEEQVRLISTLQHDCQG